MHEQIFKLIESFEGVENSLGCISLGYLLVYYSNLRYIIYCEKKLFIVNLALRSYPDGFLFQLSKYQRMRQFTR